MQYLNPEQPSPRGAIPSESDESLQEGPQSPSAADRTEVRIDSLFSQAVRAPTSIHSDDIYPHWELRIPACIQTLVPDAELRKEVTKHFMQPLKDLGAIIERQKIISALAALPDIDAFASGLSAAFAASDGLFDLFAIVDSGIGEVEAMPVYHNPKYYAAEVVARARQAVDSALEAIPRGAAEIERALSVLETSASRDNLQPLIRELGEIKDELAKYPKEKILTPPKYEGRTGGLFDTARLVEGIDGESSRASGRAIETSLQQLCFLVTAARMVKQGLLEPVTFDSGKTEEYKEGWNIFYPETRAHTNDSPASVPVVAFSGSNKSGKSVSGVHQNFFIQVLAQSCGFSTVRSGNLHVYDAFALIDRARSDFHQGRSALTAEGHTHAQAYETYGEKPFIGADEPFSTVSPREQAAIMFGQGHYVIKKGGRLLYATHSQDFTARATNMPGYAVYHFSSSVGSDGKITYHYKLTPGARSSEGVAAAFTTNLLPDVVSRAKEIASGTLEWRPRGREQEAPAPDSAGPAIDEGKFQPIFNRNASPRREWFDVSPDRSHYLQVFSFDSTMRRPGGEWAEMAESMFSRQSFWDHLASGEETFYQLDRMILERPKSSRAEREVKQAMWRELADHHDLERLHQHTVTMARIGEHSEQVRSHVLALWEFNRHVYPRENRANPKGVHEQLALAVSFLELQEALLGQRFTHRDLLDGLRAAGPAIEELETWISGQTAGAVVELIRNENERPLDADASRIIRQTHEALAAGTPYQEPATRGAARDYLSKLKYGEEGKDIGLLRRMQDMIGGITHEDFDARVETFRKYARALSLEDSIALSDLMEVPEVPVPAEDVRAACEEIGIEQPLTSTIGDLRLLAQSDIAGSKEQRALIATYCENLRALLFDYTPASRFFDTKHFEALGFGTQTNVGRLIEGAQRTAAEVTNSNNSGMFERVSAYTTDFAPVAGRLLPFLEERSASNSLGWLGGHIYIDWPLRQLVRDSSDFWELPQWLKGAQSAHLRSLGGLLEGCMQRFGVPLGLSVATVKTRGIGEPAQITIKDPAAYWSKYSGVAEHFLSPELAARADGALKAGEIEILADVLARMQFRSPQQLVRASGSLYLEYYAPKWARLEAIDAQLSKIVSEKFPEQSKPRSRLQAMLSASALTPQEVLELSAISESMAGTYEKRYTIYRFLAHAGIAKEAWSDICGKDDAGESFERQAAIEYVRRVVLSHPLMAELRKAAEEMRPLFEEVEAIRLELDGPKRADPISEDDEWGGFGDERPLDEGEEGNLGKPLEPDRPEVTWPRDVYSVVNQAFQREAAGLFLVGDAQTKELNAILDETASILSVGIGVKKGTLCIVEPSTNGELIVEEARSLLSNGNKQAEIPQSASFSDDERGEGINGPNKSGKTHRLRIIGRALSCAAQLGVAPAKRVVLPEIDGVVFVDRITTKTEAKLGSAGNELKVWSSIWPMLDAGRQYLVLVDEAFSTMTAADQAIFSPALSLEIMERGHYLSFSSHNPMALEAIVASGAPFVPKYLGYYRNGKDEIVFTRELKTGFAPSEARSILRQEGYPEELLEGCIDL